MANLDWATNVDLAFFQQDKKTDFFHKHIADWELGNELGDSFGI